MSRLRPLWRFIGHNKYWIVTIFGVFIVGFFDENSILQHVQNRLEIHDLEDQINVLKTQYEQDEKTLHELRTDPSAITKIAREHYFMKADDEDIFVLRDDNNNVTNKE
ncbi:MAG: septum formation initiator family protein [Prevotella sp.]|nr:septum formation initiator family protein [Prevotella sp.]